MESIPLEVDDIFDDEDDDIIPTRLPDLEEMETDLQPMEDRHLDDDQNADGNDEATDNPELLAKLKSMKGASKNTARKTFPKLDATRLTGDRGIPILPKVFNDVPLKGKNHEVEDLKIIMHHLEHWGHRLFPKMPFAEVLERVERLGVKKEVQTCVKRIRLGMPVLPGDEGEEDDDVQRVGEVRDADSGSNSPKRPDEDEIEDLIREQEEIERQRSQSAAGAVVTTDETAHNSTKEGEESLSQTLSNEMKERMERSKRLAMEKRAAKLGNSPYQVKTPQTTVKNCSEDLVEDCLDQSNSQDSQTFESALEALVSMEDDIAEELLMNKSPEKISSPVNGTCISVEKDNNVDVNVERQEITSGDTEKECTNEDTEKDMTEMQEDDSHDFDFNLGSQL